MPRERLLSSTADYDVVIVEIQSQVTVGGIDQAYGIRNRSTGVVEVRCYTLPEALVAIEQLQNGLDRVMGRGIKDVAPN